jgi:hypothetical protein
MLTAGTHVLYNMVLPGATAGMCRLLASAAAGMLTAQALRRFCTHTPQTALPTGLPACMHVAGPAPTCILILIMLSMAALSHTTLRAASMFIAISFVTAPAVASRMQNTTRRTMACARAADGCSSTG